MCMDDDNSGAETLKRNWNLRRTYECACDLWGEVYLLWRSLKERWAVFRLPKCNQMAREPRVIRGRLRHCNGIQAPFATVRAQAAGKAGARSKPEVRIPV